jgi:hypothetical protein
VVPSNVDIATTEALSMAQEVDPEGDRTIGKKSGELTVACGVPVGTRNLSPGGQGLSHNEWSRDH